MHQLPDKVFDSKEATWSFKQPLCLGTGLVEDPGGEVDFWVHWTLQPGHTHLTLTGFFLTTASSDGPTLGLMYVGPSVPEPTQPDAACLESALSSGFCVIQELLSQSLHSIQPGACHSPASDGTGLQGLLDLIPKHFQAILAGPGHSKPAAARAANRKGNFRNHSRELSRKE